MNPLVSICIPVFNRRKTVIRALDSALSQTYGNVEIIAVDNASTDGTFETLQHYSAKDSRVRCYRNDRNIGPVNNWKRCVELSHGEFTKILYSDDRLTPCSVEELLRPFLQHHIAFSHGMAEFDLPGKNYPPAYRSEKPGLTKSIEFLFQHAADPEALVSPSVAMFRRNDLLASFTDFIPSPDQDYCNSRACGHDTTLFFRISALHPFFFSVNKPVVVLSSSEEEPSISALAVSQGEAERKRACYRFALAHFLDETKTFPEDALRQIRSIAFLRDLRPAHLLRDRRFRDSVGAWNLPGRDLLPALLSPRVVRFVALRLSELYRGARSNGSQSWR